MPIVVSTTISAGRMLGTVMKRNIRRPLTPSSRAASTMSSGIALIAADSTVIAKPAWIQIMMTIRKSVFQGSLSRNRYGVQPEPDLRIWLSRPICVVLGGAGSRRRTSR